MITDMSRGIWQGTHIAGPVINIATIGMAAERRIELSTRYSDDDYLWPAGIAPWLIERKESEIIQDDTRSNFGKNMPKPSQNQNFLGEDKKHSRTHATLALIARKLI